MDYLRQIEDDLNNICQECKKKHPEVKEAAEKALQSLRMIREVYVSDVMRKDPSQRTRSFPTSSDLSAPYILACNYSEGSSKLVGMALSGLHMLLSYEVVPPAEVKNILRVLTIQTTSGKTEHHMKILQLLLLIVNLLSNDDTNFQYLTESTLNNLFTLCVLIGEAKSSVSLASTAMSTASQVVAIVLEETEKIQLPGQQSQSSWKTSLLSSSSNLLSDIINFAFLKPGQWIKNVHLPQNNALDIVFDMLTGHKGLFQESGIFVKLWREKIIPFLIEYLRNIRDEYISLAGKYSVASASAIAYRVIRLSRFVLIDFIHYDILDDCGVILTLLLHLLQHDNSINGKSSSAKEYASAAIEEPQTSLEKAASIFSVSGTQSLLTKLSAVTYQKPISALKSFQPPASFYLTVLTAGNPGMRGSHGSYQLTAFQIPSHPAGCCLETVLSFLLSDFSDLASCDEGLVFLGKSLTSITMSLSHLLSNALNSDSNCKDLEQAMRGSQVITLLEGVLSGAEDDVGHILRSIQDILLSSSFIEPSELLVLAFEVLQVCVRVLTKFCLQQASNNLMENEILFSIPPDVLRDLPTHLRTASCDNLYTYLREICENCFEPIHEACLMVLLKVDCTIAVHRSLGMLTELSLCCGFTGCVRACNIITSSLCKHCVPKWHGLEIENVDSVVNSNRDEEHLRWRHIQAFIRLVQIVHLLADVISDWDTIIDSFAQLFSAMQSKNINSIEDSAIMDLSKVGISFDRFKLYTLFISDDALVRLMSSLVAISLNELGESSRTSALVYGKHSPLSDLPMYMKEAQSSGVLTFSFRAIIDIAKLNSYRVSSVWQMVTSHLRMVASQKSVKMRSLAISATHDVISSALTYMMKPYIPLDKLTFVASEKLPDNLSSRLTVLLSDEILFSWVMPTFETVFSPRPFHKLCLIERALSDDKSKDANMLKLSRYDLLSSLKTISSVNYDDVKNGILNGLLLTLQHDGHLFAGAWQAIVEVLILVPTSLDGQHDPQVLDDSTPKSNASNEDTTQKWSKLALITSFNCMKLIIDDFQDLLEVNDTFTMLQCLSAFCSQQADVNISLTSIELIWKISDYSANIARESGLNDTAEIVIQTMMTILKDHSTDKRPEIRHCAMNTLFGSIVVNSSKLSSDTWRFAFSEVLFPLFDNAGARSLIAVRMNENAMAPELKKGVKMTIHHSRDTAHKQWSETRVLSIKGISRILRSCTKVLLRVNWFSETWNSIIEICRSSITPDESENEVSIAGLDCLFSMLKFVSMCPDSSKAHDHNQDPNVEAVKIREALWTQSWKILTDVSCCDLYYGDLALHFCQNLSALYTSNVDYEFRYSHNLMELLKLLSIVSRPRVQMIDNYSTTPAQRPTELQIQRCILELLKKIKSNSNTSMTNLMTTVSEICFGDRLVLVQGAHLSRQIYLGSCPLKLRMDVATIMTSEANSTLLATLSPRAPIEAKAQYNQHEYLQVLHIVSRMFTENIFGIAIENKMSTIKIDELKSVNLADKIKDVEPNSSAPRYFGFFTAVKKFLSTAEEEQSTNRRRSSSIDMISNSSVAFLKPVMLTALGEAGEKWVPAHLLAELKFYHTLLSEYKALYGVSSIDSWFHIKHVLMCVLSPWRYKDVMVTDYNLTTFGLGECEESSRMISEILAITTSVISENQIPDDVAVSMIDSLVGSCRLSIIATFETWTNIDEDEQEEQAIHRLAFAKFYENIWTYLRDSLQTFLLSSSISVSVYHASLKGLLVLSSDLCSYSIKCYHHVKLENTYNPILSACEAFFSCLLSLSTQFDNRNFSLNLDIKQEAALWSDWIKCFLCESIELIDSDEHNYELDHLQILGNIQQQSHLLAILPYAQKLLATYDGVQSSAVLRIKAVVAEVIESVDIRTLTSLISRLTEEMVYIKRENHALRTEINSVKSAAALPF